MMMLIVHEIIGIPAVSQLICREQEGCFAINAIKRG